MAFQDDARLVARILAGEAGAVEQFISKYQQFIYAILVRYLSLAPDEAEEVFQRLLFHLWEDGFRRLREWRGQTALSAYIARITRNLAHDYWRERRFETNECPDIALDDRGLANVERAQIVQKALSRLSKRDRDLLHRSFYLEESHGDIAVAFHTTANNIAVALSRARSRLKKILKRM